DVELFPGKGHDFHKHPDQEEVIVCVKGTLEQWVGEEMRMLKPGDAVFIQADEVHASFNMGDENAYALAILGPCVGEIGYEVVEVADQAPWNSLRSKK
ncbi:MAG: cupin domain-containing protein, partial [Chloroflexota bacterium]